MDHRDSKSHMTDVRIKPTQECLTEFITNKKASVHYDSPDQLLSVSTIK